MPGNFISKKSFVIWQDFSARKKSKKNSAIFPILTTLCTVAGVKEEFKHHMTFGNNNETNLIIYLSIVGGRTMTYIVDHIHVWKIVVSWEIIPYQVCFFNIYNQYFTVFPFHRLLKRFKKKECTVAKFLGFFSLEALTISLLALS